MYIEFLHTEVINFLSSYSLFTLSSGDRVTLLYENGLIDAPESSLSNKQMFNNDIIDAYKLSPLIRNKYLENKVKEVTGNEIKIIDHSDSEITGIHCAACRFIVFDKYEDSVFEICPVCGWQSDSLSEDGYSKLNGVDLKTFRNTSLYKDNVSKYMGVYIRD